MKLLFLSFWLLVCPVAQAQYLEAVNEDSTQRKTNSVGQSLECVLQLPAYQAVVRGTLRLTDSTSFRVETKPGMFTTVMLAQVVRLRRVGRFYLSRFENEPVSAYSANAFLGQSNIGGMTGTDPTAALVELAGMVIVGTGISLLWGDFDKLPKGPSTYRGWHFVARP